MLPRSPGDPLRSVETGPLRPAPCDAQLYASRASLHQRPRVPARFPVISAWAGWALWALSALIGLAPAAAVHAAWDLRGKADVQPADERGIQIIDGSFVHNVGELQLNITNWGLIGSRPTLHASYSNAPSAMWPAGSGVDYLWAAGLWVGALKNGLPYVTTGQYATELISNPDDPLDTIYRMREGEPNGLRYPEPGEDDDGDGRVNEDPRNGLDDDLDGRIDEDYAAISHQHFRCEMRDDWPALRQLRPDHEPLGLQVVQDSYQWENDDADDFVGFEFTIRNVGTEILQGVYVGLFSDCDIGPRSRANISDDDLPGFWQGRVRAPDGSWVPLSMGYMYDADGDSGRAGGYIGVMFLGHNTDPSGERAPRTARVRSFQLFPIRSPFDWSADYGDYERYYFLSNDQIDRYPTDPSQAADYAFLISTGPFTPLRPGTEIHVQAAIVVGAGLDGLQRNAAEAALTFYGAWFDRDNDPSTGLMGRETKVCMSDLGPPGPLNPIFSLDRDCGDSLVSPPILPQLVTAEDLDARGCVYIDNDCALQQLRGAQECWQDGMGAPEDSLAGCTGVGGREFHVPWLTNVAPLAPGLRLWETHDRVHVYWDDADESRKDPRRGLVDFEGYQVWRADNWTRPVGSSIANGPASRQWRLIAGFDVVDSFLFRRQLSSGETQVYKLPLGPNTGLEAIRYTPRVLREGSPEAARFADLNVLLDRIVAENPALPAGHHIRYRDELGTLTPLGERYAALQDWECCYDQLDTLFVHKKGGGFLEYVDREVHDGRWYFYSVTGTDFELDPQSGAQPLGPGLAGDPQGNFHFAIPRSQAQSAQDRARHGSNVYVVPNPATREALAEFYQVHPAPGDPTGVRIEFRNLPLARNRVRIFTLSGDLVAELWHDGTAGNGSLSWNLISGGGREITSGIYLFAVESNDTAFDRVIGRFVVVR